MSNYTIEVTENVVNLDVLKDHDVIIEIKSSDNFITFDTPSGYPILFTSGTLPASRVDSGYLIDNLTSGNTIVRTLGDQTIGGNKTFSNDIVSSGNLAIKSPATIIGASHFPVFISDPSTFSRNIYTRTSSQIKSDLALNNVQNIALSGVNFVAGSGLVGGGTLSTSRSFDIGQGDGLIVSADSIAVDSTVIRTTGEQTLSGGKTFSGTGIKITTGAIGIYRKDILLKGNTGTLFNNTVTITPTTNLYTDRIYYLPEAGADADFVLTAGGQTITGPKTFTNLIVFNSGTFQSLKLGGIDVSVSGHAHTSSNITDFNSSVSGLLPITLLTAGSGIGISGVGSNYTISTTGTFGLTQSQVDSRVNTLTSGVYAPLNSPSFSGVPLTPTATAGTNSTQIASTAFVRTEISNLVSSAPLALDTLNELATALGNDANFSTTVTNNLASKANLSGATFTGSISGPSGNFTSLKINNVDVSANGHTHTASNITDFNTSVDSRITSANLQPSGNYSITGHTHSISNITGLQTALDNKQASGNYALSSHTHASSDITNFNSSVSGLLPVGTANYLSKFGTGGSGLSNSLVFDNGTNVGIGTTSPISAFHIASSLAGSAANTGVLINTTHLPSSNGQNMSSLNISPTFSSIYGNIANTYGLLISPVSSGQFTTTNSYGLYVNAANILNGSVTNNYAAVFMSGNVGIGTASPSSRLEVAASATTSVDIAHFSNSNGVEKAKFSLSSNGDGTLSLIDGNNVTNAFLSSSSTSSSYVNGKFGIGTTTPSGQLHLAGLLQGNTIGTTGIIISNSHASQLANGQDHTSLYVNPTFLTSSSNLNNTYGLLISPSSSGQYNTTNSYGLYVNASALASGSITNNYSAVFMGGNVGIGTASPTARLHVVGTGLFTSIDINNSAITGQGALTVNGGIVTQGSFVRSSSFGIYGDNNTKIYKDEASALKYSVSSSSYRHSFGYDVTGTHNSWMVIGSSGVGIGTTAPQELLHVSGTISSSAGNLLRLNNSNATTNPSINFRIGGVGNYDSHFFISRNGTDVFGIDTNNRGLFLNSFSLFGNQTFLSYNNANAFIRLQNTTTNDLEISAVSGILFQSSQSTKMRMDQSGKFGIGTTTPSVQLDVVGTGIFSSGIGVGINTPLDLIHVSGSSVNAQGIRIDNGDGQGGSIQADNGALYFKSPTATAFRVQASKIRLGDGISSTAIELTSNGSISQNGNGGGLTFSGTTAQFSNGINVTNSGIFGSVGIGTTTPSTQLHVIGSGVISSGLIVNGNLTFDSFTESVVAIGNSSTSQTISLTSGTVQTCTLTGNCTFTMPTATAGKSFTMFLNTGTGNFTATFSGVRWADSATPTATILANKVDIYSFISDGTYWYGSFSQNYG